MNGENRALTDADVQAIVDELERRMPALVAKPGAPPERVLLTAQQVATRLGVSPQWVRAHKQELGAQPMGDGPRPRLRFDPNRVEAIEWQNEQDQTPTPNIRRRPRSTPSGVPLLPIRGALE